MVSSSCEGSASKMSIVRRRSVTRMGACGSWASDRGQASMLQEQQRNQSGQSTGWLQSHLNELSHDPTREPPRVNRGPAIWATAVALALINIGIATSIVALMRTPGAAPIWAGLVVVANGVVALVIAV